jgi:phosphoribosylformimino-5-aminoimidazole carboxamide ribotide isomerase
MAKIPFQVIPVLDIMNGQAVHAVAGRRAYYRPIQSVLHASSEPIPLARALRESLGLKTIYLADLDAIEGHLPRLDIYRKIIDSGVHLWIDCGVHDIESVAPLLDFDQSMCTIIAGLESVQGPQALAEIVKKVGGGRIIFSLDLFEGHPRIAAPANWTTGDPRELARAAIECGVRRMLILDLARVGTSRGPGTNSLISQIRAGHPSVMVSVGGGISRIEEVVELRNAGAPAILVGSAIHDGRIGSRELEQIEAASDPGSIR